jgi:hypothetical protein
MYNTGTPSSQMYQLIVGKCSAVREQTRDEDVGFTISTSSLSSILISVLVSENHSESSYHIHFLCTTR